MIHGPWISLLGKGNDFQRRMKKKKKYGLAFLKTHIQRVHFSGTSITYVEILRWKWTNTRKFTYDFPFSFAPMYHLTIGLPGMCGLLAQLQLWAGSLTSHDEAPKTWGEEPIHFRASSPSHMKSLPMTQSQQSLQPPYALHGMSHPTGMS